MSVEVSQPLHHACPVCDEEERLKHLCSVNGHAVFACSRCGADHVFPMPDAPTLAALYDRREWFEGGEPGGYDDYDAQSELTLSLLESLLAPDNDRRGLSILDVGCGYGNHLAAARARGWQCFGIEPSSHARRICHERHGDALDVVASADDLIPHEFDLVLMFDVIEHLPDPYALFFSLFNKGAIGPRTRIAITTPNAACAEATGAPQAWRYRHPPSHLVFYSAESLRMLLSRLHFREIQLAGLYPAEAEAGSGSGIDLQAYSGLLCTALGGDFFSFMQERYVPGTWSKIAEYEHLPRYLFADRFAASGQVLDFGCGTGYGAALLAGKAEKVVGLDIDTEALRWARDRHRSQKIEFVQSADLGAALPAAGFDLVTCFEMIEHVDHATQIAAVSQFARVLKPDGLLMISTPNPAVTANYGENPYHKREMTEEQFLELLTPAFAHVRIFRQWTRPSVLIDSEALPRRRIDAIAASSAAASAPLAFIAICSQQLLPDLSGVCYFDSSFDYIAKAIHDQQALDKARIEVHERRGQASVIESLRNEQNRLEHEVELRNQHLAENRQIIQAKSAESASLARQLADAATELDRTRGEVEAREGELSALRRTKLFRLRQTILEDPLSWRKVFNIGYLLVAMATPLRLRTRLAPLVMRLRQGDTGAIPATAAIPDASAYHVAPLRCAREARPRIVHAIANFMVGGSSRLVVDLVEHLGDCYEQEVITSHIPSPPAYAGLPVHEFRNLHGAARVVEYLRRFRPQLMHVHYWGASDKPWYDHVFAAAREYGCTLVENVNTPVAPYAAAGVARTVYVSEYVLRQFGREDENSRVIHPGSNFDLFQRPAGDEPPEDCIGMVYRLEPDKLNAQAIDAFIEVVRRRPATRVLIVGGGAFLEAYRRKAAEAGVAEAFTFTDYVPYAELPAWYRRMSLFVAPVWKESFGQVSPFAMSMGIPVVGYAVGALAEIIGSDELLAPPGDSATLAAIIVDLLNDRPRRRAIGTANRERAQRLYSVHYMIEAYRQLYGGLLGGDS